MPGKSKKGGGLEVKSSAYTPYKMKGSPMKRNFGIGSSPLEFGFLKKALGGVKNVAAGPLGALFMKEENKKK